MTSIPSSSGPKPIAESSKSQDAVKIDKFTISPKNDSAFQNYTLDINGKKHQMKFSVFFPASINSKTGDERLLAQKEFLKQFTETRVKVCCEMAASVKLDKGEALFVKQDNRGKIETVEKHLKDKKIEPLTENTFDKRIAALKNPTTPQSQQELESLKTQRKLFEKMKIVYSFKSKTVPPPPLPERPKNIRDAVIDLNKSSPRVRGKAPQRPPEKRSIEPEKTKPETIKHETKDKNYHTTSKIEELSDEDIDQLDSLLDDIEKK